ncbi:hypothetical protein LMG28614_02784 [Paraburkholderia ultramafica]|uniref:Uncharacterized protein n=1 Tax=Paraburkholderia ultramafica TaxID=1544867 RepID=A0A6S7B6I3_9BURK|nr:hypothetical protein LMG28614_02784 [Paraburkholderia ultramafica]
MKIGSVIEVFNIDMDSLQIGQHSCQSNSMMGFKDFRCARINLSGTEVMHMIRKGQMKDAGIQRTAAEKFYSMVI